MYEHFDTLKQIYAGNAATKPLPFGISINSDHQHDNSDDEDGAETSEADDVDMNVTLGETPLTRHGKRKAVDQSVKLIDSKRRHMERQLSLSQKDNIFLEEAKEDRQFRKDMLEALKQSNESYMICMNNFTEGMKQSMQMLTHALMSQGNSTRQDNAENADNFTYTNL